MKAGDKVVCVKSCVSGSEYIKNIPVGKHETISAIHPHIGGKIILSFIGYNQNHAYLASCFVPLDDWHEAETMVEELLKEETIEV